MLGIDGEIVIADNGSQQIAVDHGARVVPIPRRGYGAALRGGIEAAHGQFVLMADADDSYALDDIGAFVSALRSRADMVMGNRFKGGIEPGVMPFLLPTLAGRVIGWPGRPALVSRPRGDRVRSGIRGSRSRKRPAAVPGLARAEP